MPTIYQEDIQNIKNTQMRMFKMAKESPEVQGKQTVWDYRLPGQECNFGIRHAYEKWKEHHSKAPAFDIDYQPIPWLYQYDMEMFIFLNYEQLRIWCRSNEHGGAAWRQFYTDHGPTGLAREEHLLNAISIRWPTTIKHTGEHSGLLVRNPWLEDSCKGIADYADNIYFGGGGQGKTYIALAFQCMLFDHFIHTATGAQCTYSTVNEKKLTGSTWGYVNKLYPVSEQRRKFSLYAGLAKKAGDFTFNRIDLNGKKIETGGRFVGVLLPKGIKDSRVIDKLTGAHDPIARSYLLDEMQSTDGAPLDAYANMFLHCIYGWFFGSGNFDHDHDLLGINVEPNVTWDNVDETTHIWEGTLKSPTQSLDRISNIIHYNNELSPAMQDIYNGGRNATMWPFLPTLAKRNKLYPDWKKSQLEVAAKRFWFGFRYEKEEVNESEYVLTKELLAESKCADAGELNDPILAGSFDFAPTYSDRNLLTIGGIGLAYDGLPQVDFKRIVQFKKPTSHINAYKETALQVKENLDLYGIKSVGNQGRIILDWSSKGPLISMLNDLGITAHYMLFHGRLPKKIGEVNPYDGSIENPIELEALESIVSGLKQKETVYAHQKVLNQQTLGAYIMRQWIENGRVRNFGPQLFAGVTNKGWDKEMQRRKFVKDNKTELLNLCDKDDFIKKYHFSTDIFDTMIQFFYMIYVKFGLRWNVPSLGNLTREPKKHQLSKLKGVLELRVGNF